MMIIMKRDDEDQIVTREQADALLKAGEGWAEVGTWSDEEPPHEIAHLDETTKTFVIDPIAAEELALLELEEAAETAAVHDVTSTRQHIAIMSMWAELQRVKLAQSLNKLPTTLAEQRLQYPGIMAVAHLLNRENDPLAVAAIIQDKLWDRVRRLNLWQAKLLIAEDAIRSATTGEAKLAVLGTIQWQE